MSNEKEKSEKPESIPTYHVTVRGVMVFVIGSKTIDVAIDVLTEAIFELENLKKLEN
ncbi:MAG TPA: hypothetical protein VL443_24110 [Cyclobacteriaceae bacterium]|jgi:hypothetical protein|nr:hypothetical protein [Cyclobacteriaceae bacterium]